MSNGVVVETTTEQPKYFVSTHSRAMADCGCDSNNNNKVADPINPANGSLAYEEVDVPAQAPSLESVFKRFYNSADSNMSDLAVGWRHSFSRRIVAEVLPTPFQVYVANDPQNSSAYSSVADACASGWPQVRATSTQWPSTTSSYANGACSLLQGGAVVATIQVYNGVPMLGAVTGGQTIGYTATRDDGQMVYFSLNGSEVVAPPGSVLRLIPTAGGYRLTDENDSVEAYDGNGRLLSITTRSGIAETMTYDSGGRLSAVTDSFGHQITLTYNGQGNLASVTDPNSAAVQYTYDSQSRLTAVTHVDNTTRSYVYENVNFPKMLTGVVDENGGRYSTWTYDAQGRANGSHEAGGADAVTLTYNTDGSVLTTDALGASRTFLFNIVGAQNRVTTITGSQCPTCNEAAATTYDSAGFVSSRRDYNGNLTCYANDPVRGLEVVRLEGLGGATCPSGLNGYSPRTGTAERKVTTVWHSSFRLPTLITEAKRTTSLSYDSSGNLLTRTISDTSLTPSISRTWTYTYDAYGRVLSADGPRTDVADSTTYTYYTCTTGRECGDLQTVTDALGHVTTFNSYNAYGYPLTITDPNGTVTTRTYDARQRLTSTAAAGETTSISYYPTGDVQAVVAPDASTLGFTYDGAHRLTRVQDGLGNSVVYSLDAMGNRTSDAAYDPSSVLSFTRSRVFNSLNELVQLVGASGTSAVTTSYAYDPNANETGVSAPLSHTTGKTYDSLNRLVQILDPANGLTRLTYDAEDQLIAVADPAGQTTSYQINGLGDLLQSNSPATGLSGYTYDSAGNQATDTDARGVGGSYLYDVLNRLTQAAYGDQTITYTYDGGTDGKGRLTGAGDGNHTLSWQYDALGRVTSKSQTIAGVTQTTGYTYVNGLVTTLTTPSGQSVVFGYTNHQITSISINGNALLSGVTYEPFGQVRGWSWANGTHEIRLHDTDGNPSQFTGPESVSYTVDSAFRIVNLSNASNPALSKDFDYDSLDRLTDYAQPIGGAAWTYDSVGNRLTQSGGSDPSYSASLLTLTYNNRGRMSSSQAGSATTQYIYDAMGQRIEKTNGVSGTLFSYDETGYLLGEYTGSGALIQETVWMGDLPVATLRPNSGGGVDVFYVHTDHLGTPRIITRPSDNVVLWRWDPDPFGTFSPDQNPTGVGAFVYNLRYPGQYFDTETGLSLNYFRDYDPTTGRYIQSDPIGLQGGINTYAYVGGNPVGYVDPLGLWASVSVNGNNVTINIPITYSGPGATIPGLTQGWNNSIAQTWSGTFGKYHVTTTVTNGPQNQITVPCGYGTSNTDHATRNAGTWWSLGERGVNPLWIIAHEAGHLMGLDDEYWFGGQPVSGWEHDIMGAPGQPPSAQDIQNIINWSRGKL